MSRVVSQVDEQLGAGQLRYVLQDIAVVLAVGAT